MTFALIHLRKPGPIYKLAINRSVHILINTTQVYPELFLYTKISRAGEKLMPKVKLFLIAPIDDIIYLFSPLNKNRRININT